MSAQNRFAELAEKAMEMSDGFVQAVTEMTAEQNEVVNAYRKARAALDTRISDLKNGHKASVQALEAVTNEKIDKISQDKANLKTEFEKACIKVGLKREDIPLTEYKVTQAADKAATTVLNGIGNIGRYIKNRL